MNEQEAREHLAAICQWLENGATHETSPTYIDETVAADIAREFSHVMLNAAQCDGMGGCRLCQG